MWHKSDIMVTPEGGLSIYMNKIVTKASFKKLIKLAAAHHCWAQDIFIKTEKKYYFFFCLYILAYRGFITRQKYGPLINKRTGKIDDETSAFVKNYAKRWREKSIFQILLHYRAARHHDLVNMSQQVGKTIFFSLIIFYSNIIDTLSMIYFCAIFISSSEKGAHFQSGHRDRIAKHQRVHSSR